MTTTRLWPNLDEQGASLEVYAEDQVTVIPGTGADVTHVQEVPGGPEVLPKYYRERLGSLLLTYDPLDLSGDPIDIAPVTRTSAAVIGLLVTDLASTPPLSVNDERSCIGYAAPGDGGDVAVIAKAGVATVDNINVFASFPSIDLHWARKNPVHAPALKSMTIIGDGIASDRAAFENLFQFYARRGVPYRLDPGLVLKIDGTGQCLIGDGSYNNGGWSLEVPGCGTNSSLGYTTLLWAGTGIDADEGAFLIQTREARFRGISFKSETDLACLTNWLGGALTRLSFHECSWVAPQSGAAVDYGFVSGYVNHLVSDQANLDFAYFEDCAFNHFRESSVSMNNSQAYGWVFNRCSFINYRGGLGPTGLPLGSGRGFLARRDGPAVRFIDCNFQRLSCSINASIGIHVSGGDSEHCKRFIDNGSGSVGAPVLVEGGRFAESQPGAVGGVALMPSTYPTIEAEDDQYIRMGASRGSLTCVSTKFSDASYPRSSWKIYVAKEVGLSLKNCQFPNTLPWERGPGISGANPSGGTHVEGCKGYLEDLSWDDIPDRTTGAENPEIHVIFEAADTVQKLTYPIAEADANVIVEATAAAETGAPASLVLTPSNKTASGLTLTLGAAPGLGASVRATVRTRLPSTLVTVAKQEYDFTNGGLLGVHRATAVGFGASGSAAGCWWSFMGTLLARSGVEAAQDLVSHAIEGVLNGWTLRSENGAVRFGTYSAGAFHNGSAVTTPAGWIGKAVKITGVYTGSAMRIHVRGPGGYVETNSIAIPFTPTVAVGTRIGGVGSAALASNLTRWTVHSLCSGHGVPTEDDVRTHDELSVAAKAMAEMGGTGVTNLHRWRLDGSAPVVDAVGGASHNITTTAGTLLAQKTDLDFV